MAFEAAALSYGQLCTPKIPGTKKTQWAERGREAIRMRLLSNVPCIPWTYYLMFMAAGSIEDYELAYSISLKIPDVKTNAAMIRIWARIAFHRKDYGDAYDAAKAWLAQVEKGTDQWSIGEAKRIIQQSAEKLQVEAIRVEKLQREDSGRK